MVTRNTLPRYKAVVVSISVGSFNDHIDHFIDLARDRISSYACMVNAHMTVEAYRDPDFRKIVENADFATADGVPVLRSLQLFHRLPQERVAGNDVMPAVMKSAEKEGLSIFFLGGSEEILARIRSRAAKEFPGLEIAGTCSPPFRQLSDAEEEAIVRAINSSRANVVLVSLGCPKQERWMASMKGRISAMMIGVGGGFPLYAGMDTRAPKWMRNLSLEWSYRLFLEPRRLWRRYLVTNTYFVFLFLRTWLTGSYKSKERVL